MNKKILSLLAVGAITTSMFSGVVASAESYGAHSEKAVEVTYNNQNSIIDPDNPSNPNWQVAIPSGVNFTETVKNINVGVELQDAKGDPYTGGDSVIVAVKSENGYKLKKNSSEIGYTLAYGSATMSGAGKYQEIATLTAKNLKIDGSARLSDDVATELGKHTDTLTYAVAKVNQ